MINIRTKYSFSKRHPIDKGYLNNDELLSLDSVAVQELIVNDLLGNNRFKIIVRELLLELIKSNKIYFVYNSLIPQKKDRLRSYKKLFYAHRQIIGESNIVEQEFDLENNKSIILGLLTLNEGTIDYFLDNLINASLLFGFTVPKGKRSFNKSRQDFLAFLFKNGYESKNTFRINFLKILNSKNNIESYLRIRSTGRDEEIIDLFNTPSNNNLKKIFRHHLAATLN